MSPEENESLTTTPAVEVSRVTVEEVKARIDRGEPLGFVDVRSPEAWAKSDVKIKGAIRVPLDEMMNHLGRIPRDRSIITYCT